MSPYLTNAKRNNRLLQPAARFKQILCNHYTCYLLYSICLHKSTIICSLSNDDHESDS